MTPRAGPRASVLLLATGGTIGSRSDQGRKVYPAGSGPLADGRKLVAPETDIAFEQIVAIGSQDMALAVWRTLHRRIAAASAGDGADAVIITHGTDTLEETAFLLDCLTPPGPPVVLVGAMRAANAPDADGSANLADALAVAIDPASRNRGVLLVMDGQIHGARDVRKGFVDGVYVLASSGEGPLGEVIGGKPRYFRRARPAGLAGRLALPGQGALPRVAIWHGAADMDGDDVGFGSGLPAGVVTAGFGHGNLPQPVILRLAGLARDGIHVVRSTRVAGARVDEDGEVDDAAHGFIVARGLSPQKSRLLLQLVLAAGPADRAAVQAAFDRC